MIIEKERVIMILFQNNDSTEVVSVIGNQLKITTHKDFQQGQLFNLEYADRIGDGALRLKKAGRGEWLSPVFETGEFNDLIASWNTDTPKGTSVEIFGRATSPSMTAGWIAKARNTTVGPIGSPGVSGAPSSPVPAPSAWTVIPARIVRSRTVGPMPIPSPAAATVLC